MIGILVLTLNGPHKSGILIDTARARATLGGNFYVKIEVGAAYETCGVT
jgi:hypothetical protein